MENPFKSQIIKAVNIVFCSDDIEPSSLSREFVEKKICIGEKVHDCVINPDYAMVTTKNFRATIWDRRIELLAVRSTQKNRLELERIARLYLDERSEYQFAGMGFNIFIEAHIPHLAPDFLKQVFGPTHGRIPEIFPDSAVITEASLRYPHDDFDVKCSLSLHLSNGLGFHFNYHHVVANDTDTDTIRKRLHQKVNTLADMTTHAQQTIQTLIETLGSTSVPSPDKIGTGVPRPGEES